MSKLTMRFWVVLLTFTLGLAATFFWLRYNPFPETYENVDWAKIPTVEYCELKNNPRRYDGDIVRLKARLNWFMHGFYLTGGDCSDPGEGHQAWMAVGFYKPKREELWPQFDRMQVTGRYGEPADIVVVGRFTYRNFLGGSDHIQDRTHLQFEVHTLEFAAR